MLLRHPSRNTMNSHPRFLPLAIWLLASLAFPLQTFCADSASKTAGKAPATKQKMELDMSILQDLDKSGVTMTEVPVKGPDKLGKLEIPFLGFVSVYSKTYILQAKELGFTDQRWILHWTSKGAFLGADYKREGFSTKWNKTSDVEEAYRCRFTRIRGLTQDPTQINFHTLLKDVELNYPGAPIDQAQIRRVMMAWDEGNDTKPVELRKWKPKEVYTVKIFAKGIVQWSFGLSSDILEAVLDHAGKELWSGNM